MLAVLVAGLTCAHGYVWQPLVSLLLLTFLCFTAFPITSLLISDRLAALVFAFPAGYILHAVLLSLFSKLLGAGVAALCLDIAVGVLLFVFLRPKKTDVPAIDSADLFLLILWLLLSAILTAPAFYNVAAETSGGFAYRAYFNADFFRNMAVSGSLSHTGVPPVNPYFSATTLHYYWFFHMIPACWERLFPSWRLDLILVQFSIFGMLAFVGSMFVTIRSFVSDRRTMLFVFPFLAFGGSYEGVYVLQQLHQKHVDWSHFTALNIDGILRWNWGAPQIDTLYRAMLYAPQHLIPLALVLMCLYLWKTREGTGWLRTAFLSLLIFATLGFSVFVGVVLILGAGLDFLFRFLRSPRQSGLDFAIFTVMGLLFLALYVPLFHMFEPAGTGVRFGPDPAVVEHLFAYIILSWGAIGLIGIAGVFRHSSGLPMKPLMYFLTICLFLIFFVVLDLPGGSDVSLKMGHFSYVILLCFVAGFLDRMLRSMRSSWVIALVAVFVIPASVTWLLDSYNCRDITNDKFTTVIPYDDAKMLAWMNQNVPDNAVVQDFSRDYDEAMFGFVSPAPPFAQRPVYLGDRIFSQLFQIPDDALKVRKDCIARLYRGWMSLRIAQMARGAQIGYLYVMTKNADQLPEIKQRLLPPEFTVVFQSGNAYVFRVNP